MKTKIPIYNQSAEAVGGVFIAHSSAGMLNDRPDRLGEHRDDFFIFFVLIKGKVVMKCDMVDVEIKAKGILLIKPFQVHAPKSLTVDASGYYISAAPFLIPNNCADVFQNLQIAEQTIKIEAHQQKDFLDTVSLLHSTFKKPNQNQTQIINGLFNALVYQIANLFLTSVKPNADRDKNQSWLIATKFKKLLTEYSFLESPSFFAQKLNISTSHLNDCVNATTGKSVTYWLQNTMIMEAQRLLYYTENDVKEIAYHLGFEDHTYFSRLFKKITDQTPLSFRKKFRE